MSQHCYSVFFLNEQPSVNRALPPVGWHSIKAQLQVQEVNAQAAQKKRQNKNNKPAANNNGGGVAKHRCDVKASRAAHVHEEAVGSLQQAEFQMPHDFCGTTKHAKQT